MPKEQDTLTIIAQAIVAAASRSVGKSLDPIAVRNRIKNLGRLPLARLCCDPYIAAELARMMKDRPSILDIFL